MRSITRAFAVMCAFSLFAFGAAYAGKDFGAENPETRLIRALENFYPSMEALTTITTYNASHDQVGFARKLLIRASWEGGAPRVKAVFLAPFLERDNALLVLSGPRPRDGKEVQGNDYFIYLADERRVRRIAGSQKMDSFFGTAFSQEDMEIHPVWHYDIISSREEALDGERVLVITCRPRYENGYGRVRYFIADDNVLLKLAGYDKEGRLLREIWTKREWIRDYEGHLLPELLVAEEPGGVRTEILYESRVIDPDFREEEFGLAVLSRGR